MPANASSHNFQTRTSCAQDLYFERHDGSAVTCEDFLRAMADANDEDLSTLSRCDRQRADCPGAAAVHDQQLTLPPARRWYSQAGTPRLTVGTSYDAGGKTFALRVQQHTPPTPGQTDKEPVLIPLAVGLLDPETGKEMPLKLQVACRPGVPRRA